MGLASCAITPLGHIGTKRPHLERYPGARPQNTTGRGRAVETSSDSRLVTYTTEWW